MSYPGMVPMHGSGVCAGTLAVAAHLPRRYEVSLVGDVAPFGLGHQLLPSVTMAHQTTVIKPQGPVDSTTAAVYGKGDTLLRIGYANINSVA